jgi:hypothetical protein
MLERQRQTSSFAPAASQVSGASDGVLVDVACDDRQTQLAVDGSETVADVRREALAEMEILASDPNKYIVVGADRQPVEGQRTVNDLLAEGQTLSFRLMPQVAFGAISRGPGYA